MSTKATRKESKFSKCIKAPVRVLAGARDFYVRSMSDCAGKVGYGAAYGSCGGYPAPHLTTLPRSFSGASSSVDSDDDLRELIRAASTRSLGKKIELELLSRQQQSPAAQVNVFPRSQSVAIGRIDEDAPCEFGEDIKMKTDWHPRSRSYAHAVTKRRVSSAIDPSNMS